MRHEGSGERRRARMPENGAESETAVLLPPLANERRSEECWTAKWRGGSPKRNAGNHYQIWLKTKKK